MPTTKCKLGDTTLEKVNRSLYGFRRGSGTSMWHDLTPTNLRDRIHPMDMSSEILGGRHPSAYNAILGRPTLNTFKARISTYHIKIKFPTIGGMEEVQGDPLQS
ncbi:UNVERIFIED_CONTAM: hypothetical protein Sangu_3205400 [Sesamum angustifolium]|uniref:Uncharacterized protein n=1 Tax=Sesamum angustifolium TaxID=2727405 RepID=A0AAW2JN23_9LAMI